MPSKALAGVKVLDLSRVLAGPLTGQMLGDLGAEVIKVERPGAGDEAREYGPPFLKDRHGRPTSEAAFYLSCNRNKKSITVNLSDPEGQQIVRALAARSDVVIENFKTGALRKYGLDYDSLSGVNARVVYCSITGFGQTGPLAAKPGYDGVFQAMSGMMSATGHPDGQAGGGPMKIGLSIVDILTSLYAANAIQAALYHRDANGGRGQHIDLALLDCALASLTHFAANYLVSGEVPQRRGNGGFGGVPSQVFACADRSIFLTAGNTPQFRRLCAVLEMPELPRDNRFADTASRIENRQALTAILDEVFATRPAADWLSRLDEAGVAAGPVNDLPAAFDNPQVALRQMLRDVEHPLAGPLTILANPIRFSATPVDFYTAPPTVGQHTDELLATLGYDAEQGEQLRVRGVI